ncbi:MAG TPA: type IV pilus secretin PilQ [Geobacteraceae bacterium]
MRMSRCRIACHTITLISLMIVFVGCAQRKLNVKDDGLAGSAAPAVLRSVKVSGDASQVRISADKPLTYTFYKLAAPPKAVIDLAQTEPGTVATPVEVNAGNLKRIDVARHTVGGSVLSRIEITMVKDGEFSVNADPADKAKLVVVFAKPQAEEREVKSEGKAEEKPLKVEDLPDSAAVTGEAGMAETNKDAGEKQTVKIAEATPLPASTETGSGGKQVKSGAKGDPAGAYSLKGKVLTAVSVVQDGIALDVAGGVDSFNAFKLTQPSRLVVDLSGVKSGIGATTISLNKFGINRARIGTSAGKVRIVFDAQRSTLPPYRVVKSDNGLKIMFTGAAANAVSETVAAPMKPTPPAAVKPVAESVEDTTQNGTASTTVAAAAKQPAKRKVETAKPLKAKGSSVEAIDFRSAGEYSQISIKVSGDCRAEKPAKIAGGWVLIIRNCQLPRKLQRMFDTGAFASSVQEITPYQVKVREGFDAKLVVKLRTEVPFNFKQEGDVILWEIKNPEVRETPAPLTETVKAPPAPTPAVMQKPRSASTLADNGKVYAGRRVTLEFSDADVRKIFQLIAEVSNLNFLISDDVTGTISLKLVNVPWDQALDVILDSKNLEKRQEGNILYIKPKGKFKTIEQEEAELVRDREKRMELKTKVFDVNFAAIGDIEKQFKELSSKLPGTSIISDSRTNKIIVIDNAKRLKDMEELLVKLDQPEKQVMIEARIVEASSTFTRDLGVQWGIHYQDGSASFLGINNLDTGFGGVVTAPPASGFQSSESSGGSMGVSFGKLTSNIQVDLRLSAAATAGLVKIISTPKVVTLNNKAAKISQGQSIPYQTTSAEGTKTEFVEAALTLEVTPHITADGNIGMKIKASNNSPGQPVSGSTAPPINKKEATTELQVMNGETTVIGGIFVDSDADSNTGVPFLMDIPLLGWLFKSNSKQKTKTELLIFITPRIVS